jgi:hypothetical protein
MYVRFIECDAKFKIQMLLLFTIHDASSLDKFNTSAISIHNYFDCDYTYQFSRARQLVAYGAALEYSRILIPNCVAVHCTLAVALIVHLLCASSYQSIPSYVCFPSVCEDYGFSPSVYHGLC